MTLPIYRGKSVKTGHYVQGFLIQDTFKNLVAIIIETSSSILVSDNEKINLDGVVEIVEKDSLAVHIGFMDINNNRLFESLSDNGKGGDIVLLQGLDHLGRPMETPYEEIAILNSGWDKFYDYESTNEVNVLKIRGIKEV